MSTMKKAREVYKSYSHKGVRASEPFEVFAKTGEFFRNGAVCRDGRGTPNPDHPKIITKATHVFHHKDRD